MGYRQPPLFWVRGLPGLAPTANPCSTDPSWKNVKRGSLTCNGADTIISCRGGNPGTNLRTGTGSTGATFAETDAWTWSASILPKNKLFAAIARQENVSSIYPSGRKCNFKGKGCDAEHLQPINVNGWFWAGAGNARIPATNEASPDSHWSRTGETRAPQPDNYEGLTEGPIETEFDIGVTIEGLQEYHDEACLAVLNNKYNDGVAWHDVACHFR